MLDKANLSCSLFKRGAQLIHFFFREVQIHVD